MTTTSAPLGVPMAVGAAITRRQHAWWRITVYWHGHERSPSLRRRECDDCMEAIDTAMALGLPEVYLNA